MFHPGSLVICKSLHVWLACVYHLQMDGIPDSLHILNGFSLLSQMSSDLALNIQLIVNHQHCISKARQCLWIFECWVLGGKNVWCQNNPCMAGPCIVGAMMVWLKGRFKQFTLDTGTWKVPYLVIFVWFLFIRGCHFHYWFCYTVQVLSFTIDLCTTTVKKHQTYLNGLLMDK